MLWRLHFCLKPISGLFDGIYSKAMKKMTALLHLLILVARRVSIKYCTAEMKSSFSIIQGLLKTGVMI